MGRDNPPDDFDLPPDDPPDWWLEEEAADAAANARYEAWLEEQVRDYLNAQKRPRGSPGTDTKHQIAWFLANQIRHQGRKPREAKAAAAREFHVSKRYIQRLFPKQYIQKHFPEHSPVNRKKRT